MIPTFGGIQPKRPSREVTVELDALAGELSAALESVKAGGFDTVGECLRIADAAAEIAGAS